MTSLPTVPLTPSRPWVVQLLVDGLGTSRRRALRDRLTTVLQTLGTGPVPTSTRGLVRDVAAVLDEGDARRTWLVLAVVGGALPDHDEVVEAVRTARLEGGLATLGRVLPVVEPGSPLHRGDWPEVRVVRGAVVVDVHHTSETHLATGIQRVARESVRRWWNDHDVVLVKWTARLTALLELTGPERAQALTGVVASPVPEAGRPVIVPWECTYLLPELLTEPHRARRLQALVRHGATRSGMTGFDCVPITSAETVGEGMGGGFASMLSAAAHLDRVATISAAAAAEYRGWRRMLAGAGLSGPAIAPVELPVQAETATAEDLEAARELFLLPGTPMVLVVGSHEPRKNHLAVLHAAEVLWRRDVRFSVVFIGGNSWRSEGFTARVEELRIAGRPIDTFSGLGDELLWGAYALARCVLFPSLNEGFGLPLAEALALGTPAITSNFGSMQEIAADGGALVVDPRDEAALASALEALLTDDALHARLSEQARGRTSRTWDDYAARVWTFLTTDGPTGPSGDQ